jgi:hypothetical protein
MIEKRTGLGRRKEDNEQCAQHCILWDHNEKEKVEHRALVCAKITKMEIDFKAEVRSLKEEDEKIKNSIVGKYWFRMVIAGLAFTIIYVADMSRTSNKEQNATLKEIASTVDKIENTQIKMAGKIEVFETEIKRLNDRQDILRDQNIKILEGQRPK